MSDAKLDDLAAQIESLKLAALDKAPVEGLTHRFYRYPARFSPRIASAAIEAFSKPGEVVLDPYMGGGTVIVEAMALGRSAVGFDLNQLATFVSRVKTRPLSSAEADEVRLWADVVVPSLMYHHVREDVEDLQDDPRTRNLNLPCARPIKKLVAHALSALSGLTSRAADDFVRCAILKTSQWALDGRRTRPTLREFRRELRSSIYQMLSGLDAFAEKAIGRSAPTLITDTATNLRNSSCSKTQPSVNR